MRTNNIVFLRGLKPLLIGRKIKYIAEQIGIKPNTLSQLANCERGASLSMALTISAYFSVSVESLVKISEN